MSGTGLEFIDGTELARFVEDFQKPSPSLQVIQGPVGSGKTTACAACMLTSPSLQQPGRDGIIRVKWAVIRNTLVDLKETSIPSVLELIPDSPDKLVMGCRPMFWGPVRMSSPARQVAVNHADSPTAIIETLFFGLDDEASMARLDGMLLTYGWLNEVRHIDPRALHRLRQRLGRYPTRATGALPKHFKMIADTNAAAPDHWVSVQSGQSPMPEHVSPDQRKIYDKPDTTEFYLQPPGMFEEKTAGGRVVGYRLNPDADNIENLPVGYYEGIVSENTIPEINRMVLNRPAHAQKGAAVYPNFSEDYHVSKVRLEVDRSIKLVCGIDFGNTPAATLSQRLAWGQVRTLSELVTQNVAAIDFAPMLLHWINSDEDFRQCEIEFVGDPSGATKSQTDGRSPFQILRAADIPVQPCWTNDLETRRSAVSRLLSSNLKGDPLYVVDGKRCPTLVAGLAGRYHYPTMGGSVERLGDTPVKNYYSHVCEANEYGIIKLGLGREVRVGEGASSSPSTRSVSTRDLSRRGVRAFDREKSGARVRAGSIGRGKAR